MTSTRIFSVGAMALVVVAGCSRNPPPPAAAPQTQGAADSAAARAAAARRDSLAAQARADSLARANLEQARADSVRAQVQRQGADTGSMAVSPGLAPAEAAELADAIHFDYNKADLRPAEQAKLDRKFQLLQAHPRLEIQIAGNCDERGSVEYNLALGERRAAAAKRYLVAHGIATSRITVVSYGEERPVDSSHNEEAWARNRRDDVVATRGAN
jgi:peptidoglycan-associated lipoprotein